MHALYIYKHDIVHIAIQCSPQTTTYTSFIHGIPPLIHTLVIHTLSYTHCQQDVCGVMGAPCELLGGWWMNMGGGLLKSTYSVAFTTTLLAWSLLSFPQVCVCVGGPLCGTGICCTSTCKPPHANTSTYTYPPISTPTYTPISLTHTQLIHTHSHTHIPLPPSHTLPPRIHTLTQEYAFAGSTAAVRDNIQWGADYLMKVYTGSTTPGNASIVVQVGCVVWVLCGVVRVLCGCVRMMYIQIIIYIEYIVYIPTFYIIRTHKSLYTYIPQCIYTGR